MSFTSSLGSFLKTAGKDVINVLEVAGPTVAGAAATSLGGPLAGAVAQSLVNSVVQVEQQHNAAGTSAGNGPAKKAQVISQVTSFLPVIEALAAAAGHPIAATEKAAFEAALPAAIDATVSGFNAYAEIIKAFQGAAPVAVPTIGIAAALASVHANPLSIVPQAA